MPRSCMMQHSALWSKGGDMSLPCASIAEVTEGALDNDNTWSAWVGQGRRVAREPAPISSHQSCETQSRDHATASATRLVGGCAEARQVGLTFGSPIGCLPEMQPRLLACVHRTHRSGTGPVLYDVPSTMLHPVCARPAPRSGRQPRRPLAPRLPRKR